VDIWNLLDILLICGDQGTKYGPLRLPRYLPVVEQCEPTLLWYLIEELLDSQSIDGCRVVFDYLESRRERLIAVSQILWFELQR
jgi:THO complex subunit 1